MWDKNGMLWTSKNRHPEALIVYECSKSGRIVARVANGVRQMYEYDKKSQLLTDKDVDGSTVERYAYDKAGYMLRKGPSTTKRLAVLAGGESWICGEDDMLQTGDKRKGRY